MTTTTTMPTISSILLFDFLTTGDDDPADGVDPEVRGSESGAGFGAGGSGAGGVCVGG